jgi:hypothetical protein
VLALGLHIDALALLRRMSQDSEFRSKVLATADGTMQSAEGVFALSVERQALASAALSQARSDTTADSAALADIPAGLLSRAQGERWLRARLARSSRGPATLAAYHKSYDSTTKEWIGGLRDNTATIHGLLQETSFQLIPSPYPGLFEYGSLPAFLGTVMTALLLTLGAPFWFNLLRQASNLRPAIAQKVAKESGQ